LKTWERKVEIMHMAVKRVKSVKKQAMQATNSATQ
jgi:hypothetical protein